MKHTTFDTNEAGRSYRAYLERRRDYYIERLTGTIFVSDFESYRNWVDHYTRLLEAYAADGVRAWSEREAC